ncbi:hypothetical protein N9E91_04310 [Alphaproteobacteria bacterium]|nr:hypothetical protein [Alphaproteobacteria bacterium]
MSTLKADTIQSTGGGAATLTKQHAAKAWATHTQSGSYTLHDSFNVSSLTDDGGGKTIYNWSSNLNNAFYSATAGMGEFSVVFRNTPALGITSNGSKTTALIKWESQTTGNSGVDSADNNLTVHGDLA